MSEFTDYLQEVFEHFGTIQSRKMFGGYGIYHDGVMFALVADDALYLKADDMTVHFFQERQLEAFEYLKNNKPVKMSYYQAPEDIFEDADEARLWATRAYQAACRAKSANTK